ncbi:GNAT family N-acetyltransferase [Coleofasciculus sp. FACHB-64]|uniref:GNAT family N-acetyltransferase n=1 Tax=Cyanophyceae TaxID=3028117 RepID=UPI0016870ADD|nr:MULTISPECIES: GNAT family N-acetyltransferase [unclassified Coleofasciculus]MBD1839964.1 GNAT family N-acetyltransferase [Coleofasciculus sp. FACHB-501]MBD2044696.1 GNAT family N-acetyltransferase [Coleofasciculus sp. FACHB-64]
MIEIKPIKSHQVEEVKRVIIAVCNEIWQLPEEVIRHYDAMSDIDDVQSHYFDNKGTFLVLIDEEWVVGSGAIRRLSDDICKLKRMWFIKDYRGRGLGTKMAQMLLDFARIIGYKKVRLDTIDEQKQAQALKLYQRLGFYFIERYNTSPCTVFMEKML